MHKKVFKFTDYFGNNREETAYFQLTKTEIIELNFSRRGGLEKVLENIVEAKDEVQLMQEFKNIIVASYGKKSEDGLRFMKNPEITQAFIESPMYDMLMQELLTDSDKALAFVNAIMPTDNNVAKPGGIPAALPGA